MFIPRRNGENVPLSSHGFENMTMFWLLWAELGQVLFMHSWPRRMKHPSPMSRTSLFSDTFINIRHWSWKCLTGCLTGSLFQFLGMGNGLRHFQSVRWNCWSLILFVLTPMGLFPAEMVQCLPGFTQIFRFETCIYIFIFMLWPKSTYLVLNLWAKFLNANVCGCKYCLSFCSSSCLSFYSISSVCRQQQHAYRGRSCFALTFLWRN